jgi:integrase
LHTTNKTEAMQRALALYNELHQPPPDGGPPPPAPKKSAAFSGFARHWVDVVQAPRKSPATLRGYEGALRRYWVPAFGDTELRRISPDEVYAEIARLLSRGLAPKTVNNALSVLSSMFRSAISLRYCEANPCESVEPCRVTPPSWDWWTPSEAATFLHHVRTQDPRWYAMFALALRAGLRRGELVALQWPDLDLEARQGRIERALSNKVVGPPKSGRTRVVPLSREVCAALRSHPRRLGCDWVFPSDAGVILNPDYMAGPKVWGRLLASSGVRPIRFHDLRHTCASHLVQAGTPLAAVQLILGHADYSTTLRYAHLAPDQVAGWVDRISGPNLGPP